VYFCVMEGKEGCRAGREVSGRDPSFDNLRGELRDLDKVVL
jgi:hypothetical protein